MRLTKRSYESCPLIEEFHIRNILGGCEKRQWLIGGRVTMPRDASHLSVTLDSLTGGIIKNVDHFQVLSQKLGAPTNESYVSFKDSTRFTLEGDASGVYSVVVLATLPLWPRATSKWAKDYCPYCKTLGFNTILGSSLKDIGIFAGRAQTGAVDFPTLTKTTGDMGEEQGSQRKTLITMMHDDQYQIILSPAAAPTILPYPDVVTQDGFTIVGDRDAWFDVLVMGQINF